MPTNLKNYTTTKAACYVGFIVQAIINNFLPVLFIVFSTNYGLSYEKLGRLILLNFMVQLVTDGFTPKIVELVGYRTAAIMCQGGASLGLILLAVLPTVIPNTYIAICISIAVYAFSSGLMEVILSPMVEMLPTDNKSGNMAFLHSFYCWGQAFTIIVTTVLVAHLGYGLWNMIPLIWAVIPFCNMFAFFKVPIVEPKAEEKADKLFTLIKNKKFRVFMLMMLCAGACEIAMAEWASMFAQNALGVSKVIGDLAGPCAFAIFMGLGRVLYAVFSNQISFRKAVAVMSSLCFLCYMAVAFLDMPVFSLAACALCGFTVSIFWPGTYSAGASAFPHGAAVMFSVFALCGDLGCSLGPWILGIVADYTSLHTGFAVAGIFPFIMFLAAVLFIKEKDCK